MQTRSENLGLLITFIDSAGRNPVRYTLSPNKKEVIIGGRSCKEEARFYVTDRPNYLNDNNGLYLGQLYNPKLKVDGRLYYLEATGRDNRFKLVEDGAGRGLFGFSIMKPGLKWEEMVEIDTVHFEHLTLPTNVTHWFLTSTEGLRGRVVYSRVDCSLRDLFCGASEPDVPKRNGNGFGIRAQEQLYTYKLSPDRKKATVAAVLNSIVSTDLESQDTVRERWFFADSPNDQYKVGVDYPIYIWVDGKKRYLSFPERISENGPTVYELTDGPEKTAAFFSPTAEINWREPTVTPNDFINLAFNSTPRLTLWREESYQGQPAVVKAKQPLKVKSVAPPPQEEQKGLTSQWWFWVAIAVIAVLIVALIVVVVVKLTGQRTAAKRELYSTLPGLPVDISINEPVV